MGSAQYQLEDDASSGARLLPTLLPSRQTRPTCAQTALEHRPSGQLAVDNPGQCAHSYGSDAPGPSRGPESTVSAGGYLHVSGRSTSATWPGATDTSRDGEVGRDRCACRGVRPGQGQAGGEFAACAFQVTGGSGAVTSCSRIGGEPGTVLLLGNHAVECGLQVGPDRRMGVLLVQEREGVFQPAVVRHLVGGQCVQGVRRLFDGDWLGWA